MVPKMVQNWSENGLKNGPKVSLRVAAPSPQKLYSGATISSLRGRVRLHVGYPKLKVVQKIVQ